MRQARRRLRRTAWVVTAVIAAAATCGFVTFSPATHGAVRLARRLAAAASTLSVRAPRAPVTATGARSFAGTPAVGALFTVTDGHLGGHFCTAAVVNSRVRDLVITAAHCVTGMPPGPVAFVPGYHGAAPYGVWLVSRVVVDKAWQVSGDPDHDVAFLVVHRAGSASRIQDITGGEKLGTGWRARAVVHAIGYPDTTNLPITCENQTRPFGAHEMEFDCRGYTDGTSGGPLLTRAAGRTGTGTVIGVIGGYEDGGNLASVSYSPRFGRAVWALYEAAVALG